MTQRVSIIIPCYNAERFLRKCIESALTQTYRDIEVIAIDDGSTDGSLQIMRDFPHIKVISQVNSGVSAARNVGLELATGDYIIFLDADDRLLPHAAEIGVAALNSERHTVFAFGGNHIISVDGKRLRTNIQRSKTFTMVDVLFHTLPNTSQSIFRRQAALDAGGFKKGLAFGEDFEFYLRVLDYGSGFCHGETVAEYRKHAQQATRNVAIALVSMLKAIDEFQKRLPQERISAIPWRAVDRHWKRYFGRYLPVEILRKVRLREWTAARESTSIFLRYLPFTFVGAMEFIFDYLKSKAIGGLSKSFVRPLK